MSDEKGAYWINVNSFNHMIASAQINSVIRYINGLTDAGGLPEHLLKRYSVALDLLMDADYEIQQCSYYFKEGKS